MGLSFILNFAQVPQLINISILSSGMGTILLKGSIDQLLWLNCTVIGRQGCAV